MVSEGDSEFVPSGLVLRDVHANEISEPADVLNLKLLEVEVSEEDTEVEAVLKGHGVSAGRLFKNNIVNLVFVFQSLVAVILIEVGSSEERLIVSTVKSFDELFAVSALVEFVHVVGVEVTQVSDELSSGGFATTGISNILDRERVVNHVEGSHIALEL